MPRSTLEPIQRLLADDRWDITGHALEQLEDGAFSIEDIEETILSGWIRKSERDEKRQAIDCNKYTIQGKNTVGIPFEVVVKIVADESGNLLLVITAYERS